MDIDLFIDILKVDSTSSHERDLANFLAKRFPTEGCTVKQFPENAPDGAPVNLLLSWGVPKIVFCTHLDTVPPYIPPTTEILADGDIIFRGRGTCDAKGQIFAMYNACIELANEGMDGFGLLLLHGEETGSYGAKEYRNEPGADYVIVGEPTDNKMVSASKGTKAFEVKITGKSFHSGYPQHGESAVERFVDFANKLRSMQWPIDPVLGQTTYNIGKLISDNPQNVLSPELTCRVYFRTTFASDQAVVDEMLALNDQHTHIASLGGDTPSQYLTLPGFETTTVAFGSDAPQLSNFKHKSLCGPGSILVAHRHDECIRLSQIKEAVKLYKRYFFDLASSKSE